MKASQFPPSAEIWLCVSSSPIGSPWSLNHHSARPNTVGTSATLPSASRPDRRRVVAASTSSDGPRMSASRWNSTAAASSAATGHSRARSVSRKRSAAAR
jgi:hypothetical protein